MKTIISKFEVNLSEEDIKKIPTTISKNMVKTAEKCAGFRYLKKSQMEGSKGARLNMILYLYKRTSTHMQIYLLKTKDIYPVLGVKSIL